MRHLALGSVQVDLAARRVRRGDAELRLTPTEHRLLTYMISLDGRAAERAELLREVWGVRSLNTRTLATTVRRLRMKIEPDPDEAVYLQTVTGVGYRLELPERRRRVESPHGFEGLVVAALEQLHDQGIVAITGPPGSGKSTLAAAFATGLDAVTIAGAAPLASFAQELGWRLAEVSDAVVIPLLADLGDRTVVVDDADHCSSLSAWMAGAPNLRWVLIGGGPLPVRRPALEIPGLPMQHALAVLGGGEEEKVLVEWCDGLPLWLELVGRWRRQLGTKAVVEALAGGGALPGLDGLVVGALDRLDGPTARGLRAVCAFAGPVGVGDLDGCGVPGLSVLLALKEHRLVRGAFEPLSTVRRHVRTAGPHDFDVPHGLWIGRRGQASLAAADRLGEREAVRQLAALAPELRLASDRAGERGHQSVALSCALTLATMARWNGGVADALQRLVSLPRGTDSEGLVVLRMTELAVDLGRWRQVAERVEAAPDEPNSRHAKALLAIASGDLEGALALELPDADGWAMRARVLSVQGRVDLAETASRRALELHEADGNRRALVGVFARAAIIESQRGRAWRPMLDRAHEIAEEIDSTIGLAQVARTAALLLARQNDKLASLEAYEEAATRYAELGASLWVTRMHLGSSAMALNLGQLDRAQSFARRALPLVRQRGDARAESQTLLQLGHICLVRDMPQEALSYLELALELARTDEIRSQIEERIAAAKAMLSA